MFSLTIAIAELLLPRLKVLRELLVSGKVQEAVAHCQRQFPGLVLDLQAVDTALAQPSPRSANSTSSSSAASLVANTAAASSPTTPSTSTLTAAQLDPLTVTFHLQCQHYIELVRANRQADALNFAQEVLSKFAAARPSFGDVLRDVVALIAYADPSASPVGHFLKQERREEVAEVLNGAILGMLHV